MDIKQAEQLARFLEYTLGRRPDEFGLVTDQQGFVPMADLLKVLHEEGWPHTRRNYLDTLNYHLGRTLLESKGHLVRALDRSGLEGIRRAAACPKLLYAPIRRRAYDGTAEQGLRPQGHTGRVVLYADGALAQKVGQRRDADPVLVTVNVAIAQARGCLFTAFGEGIFLTEALPPDCCRLPRPPATLTRRIPDPPAPPKVPGTPGSFILDIEPLAESSPPKSRERRHRSKERKKDRQKARRWKEERNSSR